MKKTSFLNQQNSKLILNGCCWYANVLDFGGAVRNCFEWPRNRRLVILIFVAKTSGGLIDYGI